MLAVGIDGDNVGHAEPFGLAHGPQDRCSLSPVLFVPDKAGRKAVYDLPGIYIGAAVIDHQHVGAHFQRPADDIPAVSLRDCRQG